MKSTAFTLVYCATLCLFGQTAISSEHSIRQLLVEYDNTASNTTALAALFERADTSVDELVRLLDDPDEKVSISAQRVIRYSGNPTAVQKLYSWYDQRLLEDGVYVSSGPIVVPLPDKDYRRIERSLQSEEMSLSRDEEFIYALALDNSPKAKAMLDRIKTEVRFEEGTSGHHAIDRIVSGDPQQICPDVRDVSQWLPRKAFFLSDSDRKFTTARILGYNGSRTRVLVDVYINRGVLAEEWFHVVLEKGAIGWRFVAIYQTGVS